MPMARAVRLCPQLLIVPPDFARYKAASQGVMAILRSATPLVEPLSLDEAYLDVTENLWNEPLATAVAKKIKQRIVEQLGLTASAGVAPNKFLAKIASGWKKPDGLTVIAPERVESFLQQLPAAALWGVGPVTAKKLKAIGVERLVDLRSVEKSLLMKAVGGLADWLLQLAQGEDPRPVRPDRASKSISSETTYAEDLEDFGEMNREIARLARDLAASLARKRLRARTVTIKVRYADFTTVTRSHTAESFTNSPAGIVNRAQTLLERTDAGRRPVRLLGVGAHGLAREDAPQPLWDGGADGTER
jgi:DNA polymerase-4